MEESLLNRRSFIKTGAVLGLYAALASSPLGALAKRRSVTITILHTNDWHSRIEPFPMDGSSNQGLGGAAARVALIEKIRKEEEHVLLLDAGDIFQGTPYFNFFDGELEYKLMTKMGYDAATLGNHDFDNGIQGIIKQLPHAGFQFVNCNYDVSDTPLASHIKPYKVFNKGGIRIGVLGVGIELKGLVPDSLYGSIIYNDPVSNANRVAAHLKHTEKCDLIICLSHLGYKYGGTKISDVKLAEQSQHIDLIIGGHTHTFLAQPDVIKNKDGKEVMVNQVGWAGINLGKIQYSFEPQQNKALTTNSSSINIGSNKC
jgi:5'-nucleotidase